MDWVTDDKIGYNTSSVRLGGQYQMLLTENDESLLVVNIWEGGR